MIDFVGKRLDDYLLIRLLGAGAFGQVYLGEHIYKKTEVAIKVLQQLTIEDLSNFINEARIIKLKHPNIIQILDFGLNGLIPFIVIELAPHGSLRHRHPRGKRLQLATVVSYVKQVANALQYAHDERLIHRDIKPENMLLGANDEVLLSDFGIVTMARSTRSMNTHDIAGTIAYMAPEQIEGKPCFASDQYALGIVVYEWLSGNLPFKGSPLEIATQHLLAPLPSLREKVPTLPLEVEQIVMKALSKNPQQRFASVHDFACALAQSYHSEVGTTICTFTKHKSEAISIKWSPDSQYIASLSKETAQVWKADSGDQVFTWEAKDTDTYYGNPNGVTDIQWSYNSKYIATASKTNVQVWDVTSGQQIFMYIGQFEDPPSLVWSPDNQHIAFYLRSTVEVWNFIENQQIFTDNRIFELKNIASLEWFNDFLQIISHGYSRNESFMILRIKSNEIITSEVNQEYDYAYYDMNNYSSSHVAVSSDGTYIVTMLISYSGNIDDGYEPYCSGFIVWSTQSGNIVFISNISSYTEQETFEWSPNSKYIAFTTGVFDVLKQKRVIDHGDFFRVWSPDSRRIALFGTDLEVWDIITGANVFIYRDHYAWVAEIEQYMGSVSHLIWSPDSKYIAFSARFQEEDAIYVLDASSGKVFFTYNDHSSSVEAMEWSPNGKYIASASSDGVIKVWIVPCYPERKEI